MIPLHERLAKHLFDDAAEVALATTGRVWGIWTLGRETGHRETRSKERYRGYADKVVRLAGQVRKKRLCACPGVKNYSPSGEEWFPCECLQEAEDLWLEKQQAAMMAREGRELAKAPICVEGEAPHA